MTKTVLVSGASGFIGSHVAARLVEENYRVRAMTRHPDVYDGAGEPVEADVSDPSTLAAAFAGVHVVALHHALRHRTTLDGPARSRRRHTRPAAASLPFGIRQPC